MPKFKAENAVVDVDGNLESCDHGVENHDAADARIYGAVAVK